jgi:hypothetical protein
MLASPHVTHAPVVYVSLMLPTSPACRSDVTIHDSVPPSLTLSAAPMSAATLHRPPPPSAQSCSVVVRRHTASRWCIIHDMMYIHDHHSKTQLRTLLHWTVGVTRGISSVITRAQHALQWAGLDSIRWRLVVYLGCDLTSINSTSHSTSPT